MRTVDHPIWPRVSLEDGMAYARKTGMPPRAAFNELDRMRLERIRKADHDPLVYGFEPPIWHVSDALLGLDWALPTILPASFGPELRSRLGMKQPLQWLLINGGQRASKSEYSDKRAMQCLVRYAAAMMWGFHTDSTMSIQYQQKNCWRFMPPAWRIEVKTSKAYVSYKAKTGFSDAGDGPGFILPNLSQMSFRYYAQDKAKIEGGNLGRAESGLGYVQDDHGRFMERCLGVVAHELIPSEWVETLVFRLVEREACGIVNFTPVNGYTDTVKMFQDGARTVRQSPAYLLPMDGGPIDEGKACATEDCHAWVGGV